MSNKTNVVEELTFEEYWERYSCASDTPKMAARAAWILAIKQERRLQEARPTVCVSRRRFLNFALNPTRQRRSAARCVRRHLHLRHQ